MPNTATSAVAEGGFAGAAALPTAIETATRALDQLGAVVAARWWARQEPSEDDVLYASSSGL